MARPARAAASRWRALPRGVWALGLVSLCMDVSSEMIHAFLPVFVVATLGASATLLGVIEGVAEGTASATRFFSGAWSDRLGQRKRLALLGYGLAALTKPVFAVAVTPFEVLGARLLDRVGKGIRGAPRDALVADLTPASVRGAAYGLRQALDTVGGFAGPLLGMALFAASGSLRAVFAAAILPAALAVLLLWRGVEEPRRATQGDEPRPRLSLASLRAFGGGLWAVIALAAVFGLARFSEAFLVLRAQEVGLRLAWVPLVLIAMNAVYAAVAAPAGELSDRVDRRLVLAAGLAALVAADLVLAGFDGVAGALAGAALWGLHMGATQGLFAALVADEAPAALRGTAFGLFHLVSGGALLGGSVLAGALWEHVGSAATFRTGAALAGVALLGLLLRIGRSR